MGNHKESNWGKTYKSVEFKRSVLAMCVMALSASAFAQDAPKKDDAVEEVIITGMKEALGSAQQVKKMQTLSLIQLTLRIWVHSPTSP